jgi:uncharacterized damage-inducible protein DinB
MSMPWLSGEELYAWVERTSSGWRELLAAHPEALAFPCDIRAKDATGELLKHIVAVELLFAEWLSAKPATPLDAISSASVEDLYSTHDKAMALLLALDQHDEAWWEEPVDFAMRSGGLIHGSRRVFAIHMLMHSIRHYAQLATIVRRYGITPDWQMDYIGMFLGPAKV